ncbi:MAG: hypothetical protein RL754_1388 [Bacteroidota bacterium]|jgi:hypothetical protein
MNHFWLNRTLSKSRWIAALAIVAASFTACEKSNGTIGSDRFVDDRPELGTRLDFEALSYSAPWDSINTKGPSQVILGNMNDPVFGRTNASFSTRIILGKTAPEFAEGTVCDSVKLRIAYAGTYGISGGQAQVQVLPLANPIVDTLNYYSNFEPELGDAIADTIITMDPLAVNFNGVDSLVGYMTFDLNPSYFQEILFDASIAGEAYLASNDSFVAKVPGLHFRDISSGASGLSYFNLGASGSVIQLYYHVGEEDTIPKVFTMTFGQNFGDPVARINSFTHDVSGAHFDYTMQDTVNGEMLTYAQGGAGAYTAMTFPGLDTLIGKGYSINKAEMRVHVQQGSAHSYALPKALLCLMDLDSTQALIKDYSSSINAAGGGVALGDYREFSYRFNVTRMVHDFVNVRKEVLPLIITPTASGSSANRVVLGGGMHPDIPVEFSVYYTKSE